MRSGDVLVATGWSGENAPGSLLTTISEDGQVDARQNLAQPTTRNQRWLSRIRAARAGRLERHMIKRAKELRQRHIQAMADVRQGLYRRIGQATLDCGNVCTVDLCFKSEHLLRFVGGMPALLDALAKRHGDWGAAWL